MTRELLETSNDRDAIRWSLTNDLVFAQSLSGLVVDDAHFG